MNYPEITEKISREHAGETMISLDGEILAYGKNGIDAFNKAKKKVPGLWDKEFTVIQIRKNVYRV